LKRFIAPLWIILLFWILMIVLSTESLCLYKIIYGIPCPGCGMIRSLYHLVILDIRSAFYYHPLVFLVIPVGIILLFKKRKGFNRIYKNRIFWIFLLCLLLGVWVVRMVLMFPEKEPMDFNYSSLGYKIFRSLFK